MLELAMHILDIVENSTRAGAEDVIIQIERDDAENRLSLTIADNGSGMDEEMVTRALDPFITTKSGKKVGLGLSLLKEAARRCGGDLTVDSTPGEGTVVEIDFQLDHVDRQPLGDLAETLITCIVGNPLVDFHLRVYDNGVKYAWSTTEIEETFGEVMRSSGDVINYVKETLKGFPLEF